MSAENNQPMRIAKEVIETPVEDEISESFLAYSLSVITSRAIPDVRDGLKPVQRRILYALDQQHIRPSGPYKKCARVVGETMGKYHPHGDQAIYDALVRMAQPFSMRLMLVDGHGNFGSPDDPPAAPRYTECRMAPAASDMLAELAEDTVDMRDNYDGTETEPVVLPARIPNLLVNGSSGIAVGMATNIAPHNLNEIVKAALLVLENPDVTLDEIMVVCPGPDFPTGGIIVDGGGVREAFATGRGSFKLRSRATIEQVSARRQGIVVSELPYTVGPERFIDRCKQLLNTKSLEGIADIKDLSDRKKGLHLVIECRSGVNPKAVLAELYKKTPLQESFAVNAVVLDGGKPVTLGIIGLLQRFLTHRLEVVKRRSEYRLKKAEDRAHIVEGLVKALASIDEVVSILKSSRDAEIARKKLTKTFSLSDVQAGHILDMPLRRLTGLEVTKLKNELKELQATIKDLKDILANPSRRQTIVRQELEEIGANYQTDRRSTLMSADSDTAAAVSLELPDEPCRVVVTPSGSLRRVVDNKKLQGALLVVDTTTRKTIFALTETGELTALQPMELTDNPAGTPAQEVIGVPATVAAIVDASDERALLVVTQQGVIKKLDANVLKAGVVIGLKDGDTVVGAVRVSDEDDFVIITSGGQLLRSPAKSVRAQGRTAGGVAGIKLAEGDVVVAAGTAVGAVWTMTDAGAVKKTPTDEYPAKGRGSLGVRCMRFRKDENRIQQALVGEGEVVLQGARGGVTVAKLDDGRRDGTGEPVSATGLAWRA